MTMRDLQRLEKLSSATELGFWAEDVILALDRITRRGERESEDPTLLTEAAEVLEAAVGRSEKPFAAVGAAKSVAATDTALGVAESLTEANSPEKVQKLLRDVASILREVAANQESVDIQPAIALFGAIGRQQLAEGNAASGYGGGTRSWVVEPVTSSFS